MKIDRKTILQLIKKHQEGNASSEEIKLLVNFFYSQQASKTWPEEIPNKEVLLDEMLHNIKGSISNTNTTKTIIRKLPLRKFIKYAAAIILFATISYFFTKENSLHKEPVIVNNNIKIGTDKATLTLDDGSNVVLGKGEKYISERANSDGEKLIYSGLKESTNTAPKIAYNYLTIPRGGEFFIELADNTKVWLNSESKIKYPVEFIKGRSREVELMYGEAYFEVSPSAKHSGDTFKVFVQGQEIEVLGTQFNVKAYRDEEFIATTLAEGKVAVRVDDINNFLEPNQQFSYNIIDKTTTKKNVNVKNIISWKDGFFIFNNLSLLEVTKIMTRWYDVEIVIENKNIESIKLNGSVSKNQNIENILLTLKNINDITYEIKNEIIYLK